MSIRRRVSFAPALARPERLAAIISAQRDIMALGTDLEAVMSVAAQRAQSLTDATGAAIELAEGDAMVYRAASGSAEAFIGLRLKIQGSISGLCVQTSEILSCDDTELDPRVDREACQRIGVRSLVVVPLHHEKRCVGVLKVMSSLPAAFDEHAVNTLQLMVGLVASAMNHGSAHNALRTAVQQFRSVAQAASDAILTMDVRGTITYCNDSTLRLFGYQEQELVGHSLTQIMPLRYRDAHSSALGRFDPNRASPIIGRTVEVHGLRKDGSELPIELSVSTWTTGNARFFTGIARDITERKQGEEARQWLASIVESSEDAVIGRALDGTIMSWNHAAEHLTGYTAEEAIGRSISFWVPEDLSNEADTIMTRIQDGERIGHFETVRVTKAGVRIDVSLTVSPVHNTAGDIVGAAIIARDITERKRLQSRVLELARTDALTGLLLRRAGEEALMREVEYAHRSMSAFSVVLFDLDHFKRINDAHGHAAGDAVLRAVGTLLLKSLRSEDIAIRWGGEELLVGLAVTRYEAHAIAERIRALVAAILIAPVDTVTLSGGVAEVASGETLERTIARADAALYQAKHAGRNRIGSNLGSVKI